MQLEEDSNATLFIAEASHAERNGMRENLFALKQDRSVIGWLSHLHAQSNLRQREVTVLCIRCPPVTSLQSFSRGATLRRMGF